MNKYTMVEWCAGMMKTWLFRLLLRYYETPRSRFACYFGVLFVGVISEVTEYDAKRFEKKSLDSTLMFGRSKILLSMMGKRL